MNPIVDRKAHTLKCTECGHTETYQTYPLFIVTGASGTGKTALIPQLRNLLTSWDIFETDILWDSGRDWSFVWNNWLRVAHSTAQSRRWTILCGTVVPKTIDQCDHRHYFDPVYYLALHCDDATRDARLRERPAWRGCREEFITEQRGFARWLLENATTAFDPSLTIVDTGTTSISQVALSVQAWALSRA